MKPVNKTNLVVNGQKLSLNTSGGAGRYCSQLYQRLMQLEAITGFSNIDILLLNFNMNVSNTLSVRDISTLTKQIIYQGCPPILFAQIQRIYSFLKGDSNEGYDHLQEDQPTTSFGFENSSTTLLHEMTNYNMIDKVGRLSLSQNFLLAVTFLDIQDYYYSDYFSDRELKARRLAYSFYKDRANLFFAISEFTKQTMIDRLGISPEKIKVTHLAANDLLLQNLSEEVTKWARSFGRFLIYPAKAWKHKNHAFLLNAFGKRRSELKSAGIRLLLTGGFSKGELERLNVLVHRNKLEHIVKILGFVSDEKLQALLKHAEFLVFPSLFEGFGMPILEAMTIGCPVLSSNAGSLPEVGGDAAIYFDPTCENEIIGLVDSILEDTEIDRNLMIQKGLENCKRFSWDKTFYETIDGYTRLI